MIQLHWIKSTAGNWLSLGRLGLSNVNSFGVYIIWHGGNPGQVVRVGQGNVADRLREHQNDPAILDYKKRGDLYVTWASVDRFQRDGVERYLADQYDPLVGDRYPSSKGIAVNSPWD